MVPYETVREVLDAKEALEASIPGWRAPVGYGLGAVDGGGRVDWRAVNYPNLHGLPAVVLASVLGHRNGTATYELDREGFDRAIELLQPAGACTFFQHPNLWAWQRLRDDFSAGSLDRSARVVVVFVGDTRDRVSSDADAQFRAAVGMANNSGAANAAVSLRCASADDVAFLREMLYEALFVPPGDAPFPRDVVDQPVLARSVERYGSRDRDAGFLATNTEGDLLGAAWVRLYTAEAPGFGYVDDDAPELAVAVVAHRRGQGIGTFLLKALLHDLPRV